MLQIANSQESIVVAGAPSVNSTSAAAAPLLVNSALLAYSCLLGPKALLY